MGLESVAPQAMEVLAMRKSFVAIPIGLLLVCCVPTPAYAQQSSSQVGALQAGAARVDITPAANALPAPYTSIRDHLHVRAVVLDNHVTRAALVGVDLIVIDEPLWEEVSKKIAQELQCPIDNLVLSATHSHSSPDPEDGKKRPDPNDAAFRTNLKAGILAAVREAKAKLQPARAGFGTGASYLNVNRDAIHPQTRLWYQGPNLDGPSDKTVAVLKFEAPNGEPIAVYVNYAMHAIDYYEMGILTADFPGVTSRFIERAYDDKVVAIWSSGAAGDQNPLYLRTLRGARGAKAEFGKDPTGSAKQSLDKAVGELNDWVDSMGRVMGEEVLRVMDADKMDPAKKASSEVRIWAGGKTLTCPGRTRTDTGRQGAPGTYVDWDPVNIHVGVLTIGTTTLISVNAEIYTSIAQRVKKESPIANTVVVTLANGVANSGYVPTDEAYGHNTFQVLDTHLKPGCAESGIVNAALDLMAESMK
jgi:neutral ceramidase